jgi:transcriptional regulator with PAS, ATPase and Fis domain
MVEQQKRKPGRPPAKKPVTISHPKIPVPVTTSTPPKQEEPVVQPVKPFSELTKEIKPFLNENGFTILGKFKNHSKTAHYIKVSTSYGQTALVHVDSELHHCQIEENRDVIYFLMDKPSDAIPFSLKNSFSSSVDASVMGVAIESNGIVCTLIKDLTSTPLESHYQLDEELEESSSDEEEGYVSSPRRARARKNAQTPISVSILHHDTSGMLVYPIISLKDLLEDPKETVRAVDINILSIHKNMIHLLNQEFDKIINSIHTYKNKLVYFKESFLKVNQDMMNPINLLKDYRDMYDSEKNEAHDEPAEIEKANRITKDLVSREETLEEIWRIAQAVVSYDKISLFLRCIEHVDMATDKLKEWDFQLLEEWKKYKGL